MPQLLLVWALIPGLLAGAYYSARLGYADWLYRRDTVTSLSEASRLWPMRAEPAARLAQLLPEKAEPYLQDAVARNPHYSRGWYELGLRAEIAGDYGRAEQLLKRAAAHDRMFLPAWTLANFYFRRDQPEKFWGWAKQAAEMSYSDLRPLFRLALEFTQDPGQIADRIVKAPRSQRDFLLFLLEQNLLEQAPPVARRVAANAGKDDQPVLLYFSERMLLSGDLAAASEIWNLLSDAGLIAHGKVTSQRPLTNGAFEHVLLANDRSPAFDWRPQQPEGINVVPATPTVRVSFSGKQPETAELLWQFVPLEGGRKYRLQGQYRTVDIRQATNVRWLLISLAGQVAEQSPYFVAREDWTDFQWEWTAPLGSGAWRLVLQQAREPGTTRPAGSFYLQGLALSAL